jgi:hypothetical protein
MTRTPLGHIRPAAGGADCGATGGAGHSSGSRDATESSFTRADGGTDAATHFGGSAADFIRAYRWRAVHPRQPNAHGHQGVEPQLRPACTAAPDATRIRRAATTYATTRATGCPPYFFLEKGEKVRKPERHSFANNPGPTGSRKQWSPARPAGPASTTGAGRRAPSQCQTRTPRLCPPPTTRHPARRRT